MSVALDMPLAALERARFSRDARFDGRFVVAVLSTHIYCRPICPVPFASAVRYYATAAEAAAEGFRPCLRCRPEAAPGSPAWRGASATVARALRLIEEGALDEGSVTDLAARVGVGPRHLNRLMVEQVGAAPLVIAQTRRLHFAKLLLSDTALPITEIALASGYGSVRRFNDAFKASYKRAPGDIRRRRVPFAGAANGITLRLAYRPPFDWSETLALLAGECVPGVERVAGGAYWRALPAARGPLSVEINDCPASNTLSMRVRGGGSADLFHLATAARRVFDLAADPMHIATTFRDDALLAPLVTARPGLRLIGVWSRFEAAVRAILDDDEGPAAFRRLAGRLAEQFGARIGSEENGLKRLFPRPRDLAGAPLEECGLDHARSDTLRAVAQAVLDGNPPLGETAEIAMRGLALIRGFGQSRAQWVGLRGFGEPDAFPADALAIARSPWKTPGDTVVLETQAEAWRPWRGYGFFHLLAAARQAEEPKHCAAQHAGLASVEPAASRGCEYAAVRVEPPAFTPATAAGLAGCSAG